MIDEGKQFIYKHKTMFDSKFDVDVCMQEKGNFINNHYHDYIEIVCQLDGNSVHYIDEKEVTLKKNEIIIINTSQLHRNMPSMANILNIIIPLEFFDTLIMESSYDNSIIELKNFILNQREIESYELNNNAVNAINSMFKLYLDRKDIYMYHFKLKLEIVNLLVNLDSIYNCFGCKCEQIQDVITYINENLQTACLNEYSKKLNYSASTISHNIKIKYNQTFIEILQEKRLKKATELLLGTNFKISYIMREVGYNNKTYFYNIFKAKYQLTPNEYRKFYKKN